MIRKISTDMRRHIARPRDLSPADLERVLSATYDVCVVGSGPGGAVAAATLARAGRSVLLVERGPFLPAESFNFRVLDMSNRASHVELTSGYRTLLLQGNALGGGTILYGGVAMRPPGFVFDEWERLSGIATIGRESLEPHFRHVGETMSVTRQSEELENRSNAIVRRMAAALGRPEGLEMVDRYTRGCAGAGMCNLGCGFDLKGNMINSFLPLGLESGNLTILTECEAAGLEGAGGPGGFRATGLGVTLGDVESGRVVARASVRARTYVLAAGAFFSSALLLRSRGVPRRERIGAKIYLQPHAQVFALFDEPVTSPGVSGENGYVPYNGVPAIYLYTGHLEQHGFFWLSSILFPANFATFISNLPPDEHFGLMRRFHQTTSITLTIRDDPAKSRVVVDDDRVRLDFRESRADVESVRQSLLHAARGFLDAGARRVFLPMLRPPKIESRADLAKIERMKFGYEDLLLYSDHTSGGNALGIDDRRGVTDPSGRLFGSENVYVADSSLFPSAAGINPSWTIMALSHRVAEGIAAETAGRG